MFVGVVLQLIISSQPYCKCMRTADSRSRGKKIKTLSRNHLELLYSGKWSSMNIKKIVLDIKITCNRNEIAFSINLFSSAFMSSITKTDCSLRKGSYVWVPNKINLFCLRLGKTISKGNLHPHLHYTEGTVTEVVTDCLS